MQILYKIAEHKKLIYSLNIVADILFFGLTDPKYLSVWLMPLAFLLALGTVYMSVRAIFTILKLLGYVSGRRYRMSLIVAAFMFILVLMQAVGQLSTRDVLVLLPATALAYFYYSIVLSKNTISNKNL